MIRTQACSAALGFDFVEKPRAGVGPVIVRSPSRDVHRFGGFLQGQANEVTQLDQFGFLLISGGESVERLVDGQYLVPCGSGGKIGLVKFDSLLAAAMTHGSLAPGAFDEDAPHRLGGGGEEMAPAIEFRVGIAHEPKPGLVDERRGLQRVARRFPRHFGRRQLAQFLIDQRQQFIRGLGVASLDRRENAGNVADAFSDTNSFEMKRGISSLVEAANATELRTGWT